VKVDYWSRIDLVRHSLLSFSFLRIPSAPKLCFEPLNDVSGCPPSLRRLPKRALHRCRVDDEFLNWNHISNRLSAWPRGGENNVDSSLENTALRISRRKG